MSNNVIGKPLSPRQVKSSERFGSKPEKAIWVSRIHRETTEEELAQYVKESIGIASDDINVRKLIKKDRDISTYSFVSFRITCSSANFSKLMDPMYWPSNSHIREFDLNRKSSVGAILRRQSVNNVSPESKNEKPSTPDSMDIVSQDPPPVAVTQPQAERIAPQVTL